MDAENEPLPIEETASFLQQNDGIAPLMKPLAPAPPTQRITRFLEAIRPTKGSNVTRIYGISDYVIAVAFTLFVVNIALPPAGLSTS
jgi:hypothetical protein